MTGADKTPDARPAQPKPGLSAEQEKRLAKALRDNLRRRKAPPKPASEPSSDG